MATPNVNPRTVLPFPEPTLPNRDTAAPGLDGIQDDRDQLEPKWESPESTLFHKLKEWFEEGRDRSQQWRQECEQSYDLTAGWQWDADDMQVLADDNRPTVTFNRISRNIKLTSGMEVEARKEVTYLPREEGDVGKSEILSSTVQWINDETDASMEKSDAFRDLIICGMGWTNTVMDYRDFEDGMPVELRVSPLSMYWDPHCDKRNLRGARWVARAIVMPTVEAAKMFPGTNPGMLNAPWAMIADDPSQPSEPDRQSYNYEDSPTIGRPPLLERSTIVEIQWWEEEEVIVLQDMQSNQRTETTRTKATALMNTFPGRFQGLPRPKKVYHRAFLGAILLRHQRLEKIDRFTYQAMTGDRDRRQGWYGMVRLMADPQRWANKWLSQSMHIMNTGSKNTILYEEGAFLDAPQAERDITKPGAMIPMEPGAISNGKFQQLPPGQFPQELGSHLLPFALQSIQDCVGVTQEQLGRTAEGAGNAQRSALLEHERREAAMTLLVDFFDNKKLFMKNQGRLTLRYILEFMNDGRLVRIQSEGNKKYVPLVIENPKSVKYDIVVEDSPDSENQRAKTWAMIERLMPVMVNLEAPAEVWMSALRHSPLPASLVDQWQQAVERDQQQQQGEEIDPKAQIEAAKLPAEIAKLQADTQRLMAQAEKLQADTMLSVAKTQSEMAGIEQEDTKLTLQALEDARETVAVGQAARTKKLTTHEAA